MKSNQELQTDVQNAIKLQPLLNAAEIGVTAKDGVVSLTGVVDCYLKKMEAEKAAKSVAGLSDNLLNGDASHHQYFTSEIATKLHSHKSKISKIDTYLSDEKHESWTSILCLIVVQLDSKKHITIKHSDNNMELAVFGAIEKLKSTLMNITE